jgi:hypothetical protein
MLSAEGMVLDPYTYFDRTTNMDRMTLGVEEAACRILERLGRKLTDAEVDYETFAGMHNFIINHAGTRLRVQFDEQMLRKKSVEDLEEAIRKVAERVLSNSTLRPLQYTS